jgi:hypothetical protein
LIKRHAQQLLTIPEVFLVELINHLIKKFLAIFIYASLAETINRPAPAMSNAFDEQSIPDQEATASVYKRHDLHQKHASSGAMYDNPRAHDYSKIIPAPDMIAQTR